MRVKKKKFYILLAVAEAFVRIKFFPTENEILRLPYESFDHAS